MDVEPGAADQAALLLGLLGLLRSLAFLRGDRLHALRVIQPFVVSILRLDNRFLSTLPSMLSVPRETALVAARYFFEHRALCPEVTWRIP